MINEKELIKQANMGDERAINLLMQEYKGLVNKIARKYFLVNAEFNDLVQEGMIGLFRAYRSYNIDSATSFKTYAAVCIKRQIQNALIQNNRLKNLPLNTYISIDNQGKVLLFPASNVDEDSDDDLGFFVQANTPNPEENMLFREKLHEMAQEINNLLSPFEKKVLKKFMSGITYTEIAKEMNKTPKSIDNALRRIKIKLKDIKGE